MQIPCPVYVAGWRLIRGEFDQTQRVAVGRVHMRVRLGEG
jgi:hypothetical protein